MAKTAATTTPLVLTLSKGRSDGGKTLNYHVYESGLTVDVPNMKKETVKKAAILGGNGTVSIANQFSTGIDAWVLIPKAQYDALTKKGK